jgi:hypothetical protein
VGYGTYAAKNLFNMKQSRSFAQTIKPKLNLPEPEDPSWNSIAYVFIGLNIATLYGSWMLIDMDDGGTTRRRRMIQASRGTVYEQTADFLFVRSDEDLKP